MYCRIGVLIHTGMHLGQSGGRGSEGDHGQKALLWFLRKEQGGRVSWFRTDWFEYFQRALGCRG